MLRAASWAIGLFGVAMGVCRVFPAPWMEPIVLLGLGALMLWASSRSGARPRRDTMREPKEAAA